MSSWNFPNMLNTILSWPRLFMCVNLQTGPQRIIGFGQTAPNLLKDTASISDSPLLLWKNSSSLPKVWKQQQNWRQQSSWLLGLLITRVSAACFPTAAACERVTESDAATSKSSSAFALPSKSSDFNFSQQRNFSSSSSAAGLKKLFKFPFIWTWSPQPNGDPTATHLTP